MQTAKCQTSIYVKKEKKQTTVELRLSFCLLLNLKFMNVIFQCKSHNYTLKFKNAKGNKNTVWVTQHVTWPPGTVFSGSWSHGQISCRSLRGTSTSRKPPMIPPLMPGIPDHGAHQEKLCLHKVPPPLPQCQLRRPRTVPALHSRALARVGA